MNVSDLIAAAEEKYKDKFKAIDAIALANQAKVLDAFTECRVSSRHFMPSNGYGYVRDDIQNGIGARFSALCVRDAYAGVRAFRGIAPWQYSTRAHGASL